MVGVDDLEMSLQGTNHTIHGYIHENQLNMKVLMLDHFAFDDSRRRRKRVGVVAVPSQVNLKNQESSVQGATRTRNFTVLLIS